ncbi:MAG: ATPase [Rhodospirillales bacterium]|nr:ATPase [Rhodospirillales bacterium]
MTALPKRFFKAATIAPLDDGYTIHLDAKPVRTPLGQPLYLPLRSLAEAIAAEWQGQGETIDPTTMHIAGYANTAIDRVGKERSVVLANLLHFAETDMLCYRAEHPEDLAARQFEQWQPILDWAAETQGVHLKITTGVVPITQPPEALQAIARSLQQLDDMTLTAVASLAAVMGSLILALSLSENHIDAEQAFQLAQLDESFQSERWGRDAEAVAREQQLKKDITSAVLFLSLLR